MCLIEANPLLQVCVNCKEEDCYNCDYAGLRWQIPPDTMQAIRQKLQERAKARRERQKNG